MSTYTPIEIPMAVSADTVALPVKVAANIIIGGAVPTLESVTAHPEATAQTIEPSTGYDGLSDVTIKAVTVENLSAANIVQGVTVNIGDEDDNDRIASVTGTAQTGITPTGTKEITSNGTVNVTAYEYADVDVANSYSAGDEGKVVRSGELVSQTSATYTTNNTYDTTTINSVTVSVSGGGSATLGTKTISANGTYNATDDGYDGYSQVTASVPASAVDTGTKSISTNGTHDVIGYASASVSVPASAVDTGTKSITSNGNNQDVVGYAAVNVAVPNTYTAGDEGKVVSSGALVSQTAHADVTPTTSDQTIDTTLNNSIKVKGDANLVAGNIKKDVVIFNTTGTYEGGGGYTLDEIMTGYPSGAVTYTPSANIKGYAISGRSKMTSLTVIITGTLEIERYGIVDNTGLTTLTLEYPSNYSKSLVNYTVSGNNALTNITVKGSATFFDQNVFRGNSSLKVCDITKTTHTTRGIGQNAFYGTVLDTLILRKTDSIVILDNISAFSNGTAFRNGGSGGTLYVPNSLISTYQSATNWSTILGYTNNQIKSIESTHTDPTAPFDMTVYYADGTSIA